jgi:hypothetical protein
MKEVTNMAVNLQVDQDLNTTAQPVKDQNGNTSPLAVSTDAVGIGTASPRKKLHVVGPAPADANGGLRTKRAKFQVRSVTF